MPLASARLYLDIFRPPVYETCDPEAWLKAYAGALEDDRCSLHLQAVSSCVCDPAQAWACLSTLTSGVELHEDAVLLVELFEEEDIPRIALTLDGPGTFPARFRVGGDLPIPFETLCERWTVATRGGRIRRTPAGLDLRLRGLREPETSDESLAPFVDCVSKLNRSIMECLAAQDGGPKDAVPWPSALGQAEDCLALLDGSMPTGSADFVRTIRDAVAAEADVTSEQALEVDVFAERELPPLMITRPALFRAWESTVQHALMSLPRGGRLAFMVDYDANARSVSTLIELEGTQYIPGETVYLASIRRGVVELHEGTVECSAELNGMLITVTIPDRVGKTLDSWLPGWERFSEQSRQMLRLLKSGDSPLPEEFLLGGILENELERWLLPLLTEPVMVNLAHDGVESLDGLPGASKERLDKALSQIRRGKPKKEIARPPYAGELLWAFRAPLHARNALRLNTLDDGELRELCLELLQPSVDSARCLRFIAHAAVPEL
ncbi:MAG TPA: hypothetical protein PKW60_14145 [Candidatus Hydrogenedentes bacterium]|nr:hypothetical protein [Candidatus Hydrogenedentota bacterium]